jgi:hypothetical protein
VIGVEFGTWTYGKIPSDPWETHAYGDGTIDVAPLGPWMIMARIVFGVMVIFAWRETMKPALLKLLPHLFRLFEKLGWDLPRRFFTPASEYKSVPAGSRLDTLFPKASDFPRMVEGIRHPTTRGRSVSIGPQSAADAYEALAYRERRRRESVGSNQSLRNKSSNMDLDGKEEDHSGKGAQTSGVQKPHPHGYEKANGEVSAFSGEEKGDVLEENELDALDDEEMFSRLTRPRVRYDVEVVTKLVVYTGKSMQELCPRSERCDAWCRF